MEILFAEELGNLLIQFLEKFLLGSRFGWYEPLPCKYDFYHLILIGLDPTYAECEVLQKTFVFPELITEVVNTDTLLPRLHSVLVESSGKVINLKVK